jgi:putative PEP-CTERM system integral membrane protein
MLLLAVRFFVVRQATPAVTLLLLAAALGIVTYLWQILDRDREHRYPFVGYLRLAGLTLLLITGLYASLWLAFYAVPLGVIGIRGLGNFLADFWRSMSTWSLSEWRSLPFFFLGFIVLLYSATLFVLMPVAVSVLYARAWWRGLRAAAGSVGAARAAGLSMAVLAGLAVLFIPASRQPQHAAFSLLESPPASVTEARMLLQKEDTIRAGLLNAYLAPQRYVSAVGEVYHVREMYQVALNLSPQQAERVQQLYETVAGPMLYQPVYPAPPAAQRRWGAQALQSEPAKAAELYAQFFDQKLVEGEREAVVRAARSTWSLDQAMTAWQAVDDREIRLSYQEVTVSEQGDWAEVELYEVYENQTAQRQEVIYYFSLPETAVITGVWLGESADRDRRFTYRVAPRGAAQTVYRNEVRRNIDPALVEQIGPSQYRLRAFPVEPMIWRWDEKVRRSRLEDGPPMHLWLTYQVLARDDAWPLPHLAEKRNVYWDGNSVRLVNGTAMAADEATWLPEAVLMTAVTAPATHRVDFPSGQTVIARPLMVGSTPEPAGDLRLAVVLDRSRSMAAVAGQVEEALIELGHWATAVDVYLTASPYRGEEPTVVNLNDLDVPAILYYGGQNAADLLIQYDTLRQEREYDAVFVLTDGSSYSAGNATFSPGLTGSPVWMVHLGGNFPIGYDDETLAVVQASGGGTVATVTDALLRLSAGTATDAVAAVSDVVDGYVWTALAAGQVELPAGSPVISHAAGTGFAAIAARQVILAEMRAERANLDQLEALDSLHALAVANSIVTPYSSMIVLVNEGQQRLLDQMEAQADRFDREFEDVGETLPPLTLTGVPEPEEWLLLALVVLMLAAFLLRRHRRFNWPGLPS